jgi:anti-anti-sigma factor
MFATAPEDQAFIVTYDDAGRAALALSGEFDHANARHFAEVLGYLVAVGDRVLVDLAHVTFMDSGGLHVLLDATRAHAGAVRIVATSPAVDRLLAASDTRARLLGAG